MFEVELLIASFLLWTLVIQYDFYIEEVDLRRSGLLEYLLEGK
jgi:hypothetical protein